MNRSHRFWGIELEPLELRQLMAAVSPVRSIDGTGNNLLNPTWGSAGTDLLRQAIAAYADGFSDPAGSTRPSARAISNEVVAQTTEERVTDDRFMAAMMYGWGQFLDHDIDLTPGGGTSFPVIVPADATDPFSAAATPAGPGTISLTRSQFDAATGTTNARQQVNVVTAYVDGSMVYGSDSVTAKKLRTGIGGKLKTSPGADGILGTQDDLLPFNSLAYFPDGVLAMANDAHIVANDKLFAAGDVRANENIELTALQTLFVREHNRLATQIARSNRNLSDEQIYQRARAIVGAEIQEITYRQWLPTLLGQGALKGYQGYKASVNAGIANEFSTALFRVGHSMLGDDIEFMDNNGNDVADEIGLQEAFFNPTPVIANDIGPILKYLSSDPSSQIDNSIVDAVRNFLFGPPGAGGFDLASLNIQRGRDHGLADYNTTRAAYGLPKVKTFSDITKNTELAAKLQSLYGTVDNIDVWVGALAEDHVAGSSVGSLMRAGIANQFERLRDGDRFWYQRSLSGQALGFVQNRTLADVISDNTPIDNLQSNVFVFNVNIRGQVFNDRNGNGRQDFRELGLAGWTVELLDADGLVVDTTTTGLLGNYRFEGGELGTYTLNVVEPSLWKQTTRDPAAVSVTRSMTAFGGNFGYTRTQFVPPVRPTLPSTQPTTVAVTLPVSNSVVNPIFTVVQPDDGPAADENLMETMFVSV